MGAGHDVVERDCKTCHSLDYVRFNAPFLDRQGWETEVNKMVKAFGAPIEPTDTKIIVDYLRDALRQWQLKVTLDFMGTWPNACAWARTNPAPSA